jgi:DNA alkylation damage repair protein AlkB
MHSGLYVLPRFLSPEMQIGLLERTLHRDLNVPEHRNNVDLHHHVLYPSKPSAIENDADVASSESFFSLDKTVVFHPRDSSTHKPITVAEFLEKKLRWITLGGQYDWTAKQYFPGPLPPFPADTKRFMRSLFPDVDAQAAIVNLYSPGDSLSVHRDISELCEEGLVSISMGCDGLFIIGNQDATETATIRLKSGDAVYMSGSSRYSWHGVPKIIADTCPTWLAQWPATNATETACSGWRGWMSRKRVNVNVRQVAKSKDASDVTKES